MRRREQIDNARAPRKARRGVRDRPCGARVERSAGATTPSTTSTPFATAASTSSTAARSPSTSATRSARSWRSAPVCRELLVLEDAIDVPLTRLLRTQPAATLDARGHPWWWKVNAAGLQRWPRRRASRSSTARAASRCRSAPAGRSRRSARAGCTRAAAARRRCWRSAATRTQRSRRAPRDRSPPRPRPRGGRAPRLPRRRLRPRAASSAGRSSSRRRRNRTATRSALYRESEAYLYNLTAFAMSRHEAAVPAGDPEGRPPPRRAAHRRRLRDRVGRADAHRGRATRSTFADFDNPSTRYLRHRLESRGVRNGRSFDLDLGPLPKGHALAYAFDVLEHVPGPARRPRGDGAHRPSSSA